MVKEKVGLRGFAKKREPAVPRRTINHGFYYFEINDVLEENT